MATNQREKRKKKEENVEKVVRRTKVKTKNNVNEAQIQSALSLFLEK
jgi:hypothetical protein